MDLTHVHRRPHRRMDLLLCNIQSFSKVACILRHKANLHEFQKVKTTPRILSDHNAIKCEIDSGQMPSKYANVHRLHSLLLNEEWAEEEIKK